MSVLVTRFNRGPVLAAITRSTPPTRGQRNLTEHLSKQRSCLRVRLDVQPP